MPRRKKRKAGAFFVGLIGNVFVTGSGIMTTEPPKGEEERGQLHGKKPEGRWVHDEVDLSTQKEEAWANSEREGGGLDRWEGAR